MKVFHYVNGIYYVHVCEQHVELGNSTIENLCIIIILFIARNYTTTNVISTIMQNQQGSVFLGGWEGRGEGLVC